MSPVASLTKVVGFMPLKIGCMERVRIMEDPTLYADCTGLT